MGEIVKTIIGCILFIPTVIIVAAFWYSFIATIISSMIPPKPTDIEIEEKTK